MEFKTFFLYQKESKLSWFNHPEIITVNILICLIPGFIPGHVYTHTHVYTHISKIWILHDIPFDNILFSVNMSWIFSHSKWVSQTENSSGKEIGGDPGKQATGYGDLLTGLEGMVRGRQDTVQDEQRYELGLRDRESDIRKQDRNPIAETGIQGRNFANWSKDKTHRVQILDLGLVTWLPWCLETTVVGKQVRLTESTLQLQVSFGVEAVMAMAAASSRPLGYSYSGENLKPKAQRQFPTSTHSAFPEILCASNPLY